MAALSKLSDAEARILIEDVFTRSFNDVSRPTLDIVAAESFDGDPAFYVTAVFPDNIKLPRGAEQTGFQSELGKQLIAHGDLRIAYLRMLHRSDLDKLKALQSDEPSDA